MYEFYVGTTPKDPPGNIVKVCLDSDGQLVDKSYYEAVSPAYLCRKGSCIYAVIENADFGGVQVFDVNKNGSLTAKARLIQRMCIRPIFRQRNGETGFLSLIMGRRPVRFIDMKRKNWFKKVCLERKKQKKAIYLCRQMLLL